MKITTPIILGMVSIADIIFGTHGFVCLCLWVSYGLYKLEKE